MPRTPPDIPPLRTHKSTGLAYATLGGRRVYLGKADSPDAKARYDRTIREWLAAGRCSPIRPDDVADIRVVEIVNRFDAHALAYYRRPDGSQSDEYANFRRAVKPLLEVYRTTPAREFGPMRLRTVRESMIGMGWCRAQINKNVGRVIAVFRWAASHELIPASVVDALRTVEPLRRGRSSAAERPPVGPADDAVVDAVVARMGATLAGMVRLQRLTGARAGEICELKVGDVDRSDPNLWRIVPRRHKTQHHDRQRVIFCGPRSIAVLAPFLALAGDADAYVFSPQRSLAEYRERQHAERRTPLSCGNSPGTNVKARPSKRPGDHFTVTAFGHAIRKWCARVFPVPQGLSADERAAWKRTHWFTSHRLRHSFGTEVRKLAGLEAASCALGHAGLKVSEVYCEADMSKAANVALKVG